MPKQPNARFLLCLACFLFLSCSYLSSILGRGDPGQQQADAPPSNPPQCDMFAGSWVHDDSYPIYQPWACPILERGFRCQDNGRPDSDYTKWRWKPSQCDIPSFNGIRMLHLLQGKTIAFVGDSMGRTQWESLVCMLATAVPDKTTVVEMNSKNITKRAPYLAFHFVNHNVTVEYHRSPFLVQEAPPPKHSPKRVRSILKLDRLESSQKRWTHADVLVFNSGHWWNPSKTHQVGCYFAVGNSLRLGMRVETAYHTALRTWAWWADNVVNTSRTRLVFRSLEPSHWDWPRQRCIAQKQPNATSFRSTPQLPFNRILDDVLKGMNTSVTVLNISDLSQLRSEAHIGKWSGGNPPLDCSHWCLPGVPDTWNQLLYVSLLLSKRNRVSSA